MKVEVNIEKQYAFMVLAFLILGVGVMAFGGNQPSVMGHSAGEIEADFDGDGSTETLQYAIENNLIGGSVSLGSWEQKNNGEVYQATTDGFVTAWRAGNGEMVGYTDSNNPPTTIRSIMDQRDDSWDSSISMPVKKGDYWKITGSNQKVYWIPLEGSGGGDSSGNGGTSGTLDCETETGYSSEGGSATASCAGDYKITGGGCEATGDLKLSKPDGNGWSCRYTDGPVTAYARCCKVV